MAQAVPLLRDPETVSEWRALRDDPLFCGDGLPHGRGEPVLVVGGFGANAAMMRPLADWLSRIGYTPKIFSRHRGLACGEQMAGLLTEELRCLATLRGERVQLVAHSRGGQFARVAAVRCPEYAAGLITLGAPFKNFALRRPLQAQAGILGLLGTVGVPRLVRLSCLRGSCCRRFRADLSAPWPAGLPFVSAYSRADRSVRWEACRDPAAANVELSGPHTALLASRGSWQLIAMALSGAGANGGSRRPSGRG